VEIVSWFGGKGAERKDKADKDKSEKGGGEGGVEKVRCLKGKGARQRKKI
jgi:hypothetical protein